MEEHCVTVLNTSGRTRLVPLQHMVPEQSARILLKLECENPTGSMKDRTTGFIVPLWTETVADEIQEALPREET
jgi:cysteine synthase